MRRNQFRITRWVLGVGLLALQPLSASTLFDNGIPNGGGIGGNFLDCSNCRSSQGVEVYDDFQVGAGGWQVTGLFGTYLAFASTPVPSTATWEIRQGVSQGNSGTLVASGTTAITVTTIATPPNGSSSDVYWLISDSIGPVSLSPGTYWMMLAPTSSNDETYLVGTDGTGGISALIDGTSFVIGTNWSSMQNVGAYLQPFTGHSSYDFSYGVQGVSLAAATPEPASLLLLAIGAGGIVLGKLRRRGRS